jgi:hypothetical protein
MVAACLFTCKCDYNLISEWLTWFAVGQAPLVSHQAIACKVSEMYHRLRPVGQRVRCVPTQAELPGSCMASILFAPCP